ncbi:MAG: DUF2809 domain-containing protein [Bacteroidota bacterium]
MRKSRTPIALLIIAVVATGLLSRRISIVPTGVGDVLWAIMMFLIIRFIIIKRSTAFIAMLALIICFTVEFSQLYQSPWINNVRENALGALVLGRGFLWSDLLAYTFGIVICAIVETIARYRR